jgi:hypothetical protein
MTFYPSKTREFLFSRQKIAQGTSLHSTIGFGNAIANLCMRHQFVLKINEICDEKAIYLPPSDKTGDFHIYFHAITLLN